MTKIITKINKKSLDALRSLLFKEGDSRFICNFSETGWNLDNIIGLRRPMLKWSHVYYVGHHPTPPLQNRGLRRGAGGKKRFRALGVGAWCNFKIFGRVSEARLHSKGDSFCRVAILSDTKVQRELSRSAWEQLEVA